MRCYLIPLCLLLLLSAGCGPKHYTATATIQIQRDDVRPMGPRQDQREAEKIEAVLSYLKSSELVNQVAKELSNSAQYEAFFAPYKGEAGEDLAESIIEDHRPIEMTEFSGMVPIYYAHPDPEIAATVANLFAQVLIDHTFKLQINAALKGVEEIQKRADQQQERVQTLELKIAQQLDQTETEDFRELVRDLEVQQKYLEGLISSMAEQTRHLEYIYPYVRVIDPAVAPPL